MTNQEKVNGYQLYSTVDGENIFPQDLFESYLSWWNTPDKMTIEEFNEAYEDAACSEWAKMDRHGISYGGFWKCEPGTEERKNAYQLT